MFDVEIAYSNDLKGKEEVKLCSSVFSSTIGGSLHYACLFRGVEEFLQYFPVFDESGIQKIKTVDLEKLYKTGNACLVCHAEELYGLSFFISGNSMFYTDCHDRLYTLDQPLDSLEKMVELTRSSNLHKQFIQEDVLIAYLKEYPVLKTEDGATVQYLHRHEEKPPEIFINRVLKMYNNHDGMDVAASASMGVAEFIKDFCIYRLEDIVKEKSGQLLSLYGSGKVVLRYSIYYGDYELEFRKEGDSTIIQEKETLRVLMTPGRSEERDRNLYARWIDNFNETEDNFLEEMRAYLEIINPKPITRMDVPIEQLFNQKTAVNPEIFFH
ncbi:hypothetical protein FLA_6143 [Filimonas lacunae]|nr:hypothetical protein FLA_6143 [Filimonas lacunae]